MTHSRSATKVELDAVGKEARDLSAILGELKGGLSRLAQEVDGIIAGTSTLLDRETEKALRAADTELATAIQDLLRAADRARRLADTL